MREKQTEAKGLGDLLFAAVVLVNLLLAALIAAFLGLNVTKALEGEAVAGLAAGASSYLACSLCCPACSLACLSAGAISAVYTAVFTTFFR